MHRHLILGVAFPLAATVVAIVLAVFRGPGPSNTNEATTLPPTAIRFPRHDDPRTKICIAYLAILTLGGDHLVYPPSPFHFLGLDPASRPFFPTNMSSHPGSPWNEEAEDAVLLAWQAARDRVARRAAMGDSEAQLEIAVYTVVGDTLLDGGAREEWYSGVGERVAAEGVIAVCGSLWKALGYM
jgi:hypothetical protein